LTNSIRAAGVAKGVASVSPNWSGAVLSGSVNPMIIHGALALHPSSVFSAWVAIASSGLERECWLSFSNFYRDAGLRSTWRHLRIRDDATGAFEPGNAGWRLASL